MTDTTPAPDKRPSYDYTSTRRQQRRVARLDAAAQSAGFPTWTKLETAIINGATVTVTPPATASE